MEVRSPEAGYTKDLYAVEGDYVEAGDLLAVIDVPDLEESLSDLLDEYETTLLNQEKTKVQNDISFAKTRRNIADIEESVREAEEDVARLKKLAAINSATQSDLDAAIDQLDSRQISSMRHGSTSKTIFGYLK